MADNSPITLARFWTKVQAPNDFQCWEWQGKTNDNGYGRFGYTELAHRVAYEYFNGPIPEGMLVLHSCDNKTCVNPKHLRVGTHSDNMMDAAMRDRFHIGPKCYNAKLTADQVQYIRKNPDKLTLKQISERFGIAISTASYVRSGKSYYNV